MPPDDGKEIGDEYVLGYWTRIKNAREDNEDERGPGKREYDNSYLQAKLSTPFDLEALHSCYHDGPLAPIKERRRVPTLLDLIMPLPGELDKVEFFSEEDAFLDDEPFGSWPRPGRKRVPPKMKNKRGARPYEPGIERSRGPVYISQEMQEIFCGPGDRYLWTLTEGRMSPREALAEAVFKLRRWTPTAGATILESLVDEATDEFEVGARLNRAVVKFLRKETIEEVKDSTWDLDKVYRYWRHRVRAEIRKKTPPATERLDETRSGIPLRESIDAEQELFLELTRKLRSGKFRGEHGNASIGALLYDKPSLAGKKRPGMVTTTCGDFIDDVEKARKFIMSDPQEDPGDNLDDDFHQDTFLENLNATKNEEARKGFPAVSDGHYYGQYPEGDWDREELELRALAPLRGREQLLYAWVKLTDKQGKRAEDMDIEWTRRAWGWTANTWKKNLQVAKRDFAGRVEHLGYQRPRPAYTRPYTACCKCYSTIRPSMAFQFNGLRYCPACTMGLNLRWPQIPSESRWVFDYLPTGRGKLFSTF